jgi:hypothetical protein
MLRMSEEEHITVTCQNCGEEITNSRAYFKERDWEKLEISPNTEFRAAYGEIVKEYQKVRSYAQGLRESVSFLHGGVAASILPVFYAGLGALAYMLRRLQLQRPVLPCPG